MKINKRVIKYLILFLFIITINNCAKSITFEQAITTTPVGFLHGLWHGIIAPISWIFSLFNKNIAIYAIYNNGGWYDFGFVLGAGILFGGGAKSSCKQHKSEV